VNATVAHVSIPKVAEYVNGDAVLVRRSDDNHLLLAVVDGLGHGPNAAKPAQLAISCLEQVDLAQPLAVIMQDLHGKLRETRGAAATLCILRGDKLEGCAVGNVQFSCHNGTVPMVLSSGVLGQRLPKLRVCEAVLRPGCRIAIYSDGISGRFKLDEFRRLRPQNACELIMERHRKKEDDATILIADLEA
jgi:negative regulator of sigma-B (phosphoserine phosphatase)